MTLFTRHVHDKHVTRSNSFSKIKLHEAKILLEMTAAALPDLGRMSGCVKTINFESEILSLITVDSTLCQTFVTKNGHLFLDQYRVGFFCMKILFFGKFLMTRF